MAKKNSIIRPSFENGVLTINVGNDDTGPIGSIVLTLAELSADITETGLVHGLVQKISDAAALPKDELTGNAKTDALTKYNAMLSVANRLLEGEWSARKGDGSGPVAGIIFRAFAEYVATMAASRKKPVPSDDAIRANYDAKSRAEQLALRSVPEIATIIERIKSERGTTTVVDADALLADLGL